MEFKDTYGIVTLGDMPSNSELDLLKNLGVNTIWPMQFSGDFITRCRNKGINCICNIKDRGFCEGMNNVIGYFITDEPFVQGWSLDRVKQGAIDAKKVTSKPICYNFAWYNLSKAFPSMNSYLDFTMIDCYPYRYGHLHQGDLDNTWNLIQGSITIPTIVIPQAHDLHGKQSITTPDIPYQKSFWLPKPVGVLWYCWSEGGGLIKDNKDVQEAIRITPYVPPSPPPPLPPLPETTKRVTCSTCHSILEITLGEEGGFGDWEGWTSNLLTNANFEVGALDGWNRKGDIWAWKTNHSKSGSWCLGGYSGSVYQDIDVSKYSNEIANGGLKVKAGGYGRDVDHRGGQFKIEVKFIGSNGSVDYSSGLRSDDSYTYYGCEKIVPAGTTRIRIFLYLYNNENQYAAIDDANLQLSKKTFIPPEPTENLLCPVCGAYIEKGVSIKLISEGDVITQLRQQINALDVRIAQLEKAIADVRLQIEAIKAELGME